MDHSAHLPRKRRTRLGAVLVTLLATTALMTVVSAGTAAACTTSPAPSPSGVPMGTAGGYAVLAGSTITNTGNSVITGDMGLSPGTSITGFPPGVNNGTMRTGSNAAAVQAKSDLTTAYNNAAARTPRTAIATELGGKTLTAGNYSNGTFGLTGTLVLDGRGNSGSVFVFQAASTLITASNSTVTLINGASACNVFWQVGSSATLGTGTKFAGSVLALTSITATTGVTVVGRLLARNGAVTLDTNTINKNSCT